MKIDTHYFISGVGFLGELGLGTGRVEILDIVFGIIVRLCLHPWMLGLDLYVPWAYVAWLVEIVSRGVIGLVFPEESIEIKPLPHPIYLFNY